MSPGQFFEQFYADSGLPRELVLSLLDEIAAATEVPASILRPGDRFAEELAPVKGYEFDDGLVELKWIAERRERMLEVKLDLEEIRTVDDYIRTMAKLDMSARA